MKESLTIHRSRGVTVAAVNVDVLDLTTVAALKDELGEPLENATALVLDLGRLEFIDSSGVGALVWARRKIQSAGGRLALSNLGPPLRMVLETLRMNELFETHQGTEQAIDSLADGVA
jgi:anti-sigma B factor antagonist